MEKKLKILIVDDEPASRELLRRLSDHFGFETAEAENGEEGWILYQKMQPDLTISDIYMPKMNGVQLLSTIKKRDERAKVILITGYFRFRAMLETCSYPPDGFLQKPFSIEALERIMASLLSDSKSGQKTPRTNPSKHGIGLPATAPKNPGPVEEPEHDG